MRQAMGAYANHITISIRAQASHTPPLVALHILGPMLVVHLSVHQAVEEPKTFSSEVQKQGTSWSKYGSIDTTSGRAASFRVSDSPTTQPFTLLDGDMFPLFLIFQYPTPFFKSAIFFSSPTKPRPQDIPPKTSHSDSADHSSYFPASDPTHPDPSHSPLSVTAPDSQSSEQQS